MSTAARPKVRRYGHFIAGAAEPAPPDGIERRNPATEALTGRFADGTAQDVDRAVRAARAAFDDGPWPGLPAIERAAALSELARRMETEREALVRIEVEEVGKPIRMARGDIDGSIGLVRYAAALGTQLHGDAYTNLGPDYTGLVVREPVGVVGAVIPWNFPALIFCQKVPFALAAGCTVVVKPSELTSGTALELARLATDAGIPDGVINVVTGYGDTVGQALVDHMQVDLLSFTGSTATGRKVMDGQKGNMKRTSMELGGKGATIVFADADLDEALDGVIMGAYFSMGEECAAGARLLVEESIAETFVDRVVERARQLRVGDPFDEGTDLGALIHDAHAERVLRHVADARENGAVLRCGGALVAANGAGPRRVLEATVLDEVTPAMRIFRDEVFGPVLAVTRFTTADEAAQLANDTTYGLAHAIYTKHIDRAINVGRALRSGTVWVNTTIDGSPQLPFGGYKASGHGREMGQAGIDEFTELKALHLRTGPRRPFFGTVGTA